MHSSPDLVQIVRDFARAMKIVDARAPQAVNTRSGEHFQPGLGPHSEAQTVEMVVAEMASSFPNRYDGRVSIGIPYLGSPRQKCDFCIGFNGKWQWAIEVKMLRILGDNGKLNDNILMHILSPYPAHRSAVTDCLKLARSPLGERSAVLIYGYEAKDWPLLPAIDAFETIAATMVKLGQRCSAEFHGLIHPIHSSGKVFGWEVSAPARLVPR